MTIAVIGHTTHMTKSIANAIKPPSGDHEEVKAFFSKMLNTMIFTFAPYCVSSNVKLVRIVAF